MKQLHCANKMRLAIIINSSSQKAKKAYAQLIENLTIEISCFETTAIGSAHEIAEYCAIEGFSYVVALGGDGTVNEIFNGLMSCGKSADELPVLCILPCGTGNDFARNFNFTSNVSEFVQRLQTNRIQYSDGGLVEFIDDKGKSSNRYFLNVMDIGLGGRIAKRVNTYRRGLTAMGAYHRAIIASLPFYRKKSMQVRMDKKMYSGPLLSVVVANGKWFGKGMGIAPAANTSDGLLNSIVLAKVGFWEYLAYLPRIMRCKPINHPQVFYDSATNILVTGEENPIQLDGEYVGNSPASIRVIPKAIRLLVG